MSFTIETKNGKTLVSFPDPTTLALGVKREGELVAFEGEIDGIKIRFGINAGSARELAGMIAAAVAENGGAT